jgi:KTSC domain
MNVIAVESSTLATIAYDGSHELLQLEFNSHTFYPYFGVPATVHAGLMYAPSKGSYFNQNLRGKFPYRRILEAGIPTGSR